MARMIEKALLAGAIGMTSIAGAGCAQESTHATTPTPSIYTVFPGNELITPQNTDGYACTSRRVRVGDSEIVSFLKNGKVDSNGAVIVQVLPNLQVKLSPPDKDPLYCESNQDSANVVKDLEALYPHGTEFILFTIDSYSSSTNSPSGTTSNQ